GVLGTTNLADDAPVRLRQVGGHWGIDAGALHGYSEGSILAVYPPPGEPNPDRIVGHVRVAQGGLRTFDADAEPSRSDGQPHPGLALRSGGRCKPVFVDFGSMRVGVAVLGGGPGGGPGRQELAGRASRELSRIAAGRGALIEVHDAPTAGDWVVR